jgi:hypothetical protein
MFLLVDCVEVRLEHVFKADGPHGDLRVGVVVRDAVVPDQRSAALERAIVSVERAWSQRRGQF